MKYMYFMSESLNIIPKQNIEKNQRIHWKYIIETE